MSYLRNEHSSSLFHISVNLLVPKTFLDWLEYVVVELSDWEPCIESDLVHSSFIADQKQQEVPEVLVDFPKVVDNILYQVLWSLIDLKQFYKPYSS